MGRKTERPEVCGWAKREVGRLIRRFSEAHERPLFWRATGSNGPLTASAVVASVSNARDYRNGRQFAASLGIVPTQ